MTEVLTSINFSSVKGRFVTQISRISQKWSLRSKFKQKYLIESLRFTFYSLPLTVALGFAAYSNRRSCERKTELAQIFPSRVGGRCSQSCES